MGLLPESFWFGRQPPDWEEIAKRLMHDRTLSLNETVCLAERFVRNFVDYMVDNGIRIMVHTPLDEAPFQ